MSTTDIKLQILLENIPVLCKYLSNERGCRKALATDKSDEFGYYNTSCRGSILECDLTEKEITGK